MPSLCRIAWGQLLRNNIQITLRKLNKHLSCLWRNTLMNRKDSDITAQGNSLPSPMVKLVAPYCIRLLLIALVWMRQIPGYLRSRINGLRQLSPSPIHQGMLENSTWHWDSVVLLNNLPSDPIVPQWGRQAAAHSRVIDWINSLIPNRWIEYWCLVSPNHRRKTQSASTAWKFNPLFPQQCGSEFRARQFQFKIIAIWVETYINIWA